MVSSESSWAFPQEFWGSHQEGWSLGKPWRRGSPRSVQGLPDRRNQTMDMRIMDHREGEHGAPHIRTQELGRGAV